MLQAGSPGTAHTEDLHQHSFSQGDVAIGERQPAKSAGEDLHKIQKMKEAWPAAPATEHKANMLCFCHLFLGNSSTTATCPKHTPYCSCPREFSTAGRALCSSGNAGANFPCSLPHWSCSVPTANPWSEEIQQTSLLDMPTCIAAKSLQWLQSKAAPKHPSIKLALGQQLWRVIMCWSLRCDGMLTAPCVDESCSVWLSDLGKWDALWARISKSAIFHKMRIQRFFMGTVLLSQPCNL